MNADSKALQARYMTARGDLSRRSRAKAEAFQTAGYSDRLAADEAALDYIATRIAPKFGVSAEVIAKRLRAERLWPPM